MKHPEETLTSHCLISCFNQLYLGVMWGELHFAKLLLNFRYAILLYIYYLHLVMVLLRLLHWYWSEFSWNIKLFGFFIQCHKINFWAIYHLSKVKSVWWRIYFKLFVYLINVILKFISLLVCSKVLSVEIFKIFYILKQTFNKLNILFLEFAVKC